MELFVSTKGDDFAAGSCDAPVKTIQKAMELVRHYEKNRTDNITVNIGEGTYYIEEPVRFSKEDSGSETCHVVYQGIGNVMISGGVCIYPDWKYDKDGIYKTTVPEGLAFDQLFINGRKRVMARYPDYNENVKYFQGYAKDCIAPERVKKYSDPKGGFIHAMHEALWGDFHYRITGKTDENELTYLGGWQNNRPSDMHGSIRFIENILEELDSPGEWYYDSKEFLYYMPENEEELTDAIYEVVCLKNLITVQGTQDNPVKYLEFRNLNFRHAMRTFMEPMEPILRSDWCIYRGGAIFLEGTENICIDGCSIIDVGGNAVMVSNYNRYAEIKNCEIAEAGANSILFAGDLKAVRSPLFGYEGIFNEEENIDWTPGPKTQNYPSKCIARGNLLVRNGRVEKQSAGISLSICEEIYLYHNTIYDVPRAGINICDGTWGGHRIEKNVVFNTVLETQDHGAFNSWGRDRFWDPRYCEMERKLKDNPELPLLDARQTVIIRNNIFECANGWDIDLDDGSSNYLIAENLCLKGGIKNREGVCREVTNNILINNTFHPHVWFDNSRDVFTKNIIFRPYEDINLKAWGELFDYNILYHKGFLTAASVLQEKSGMDAHSVCAELLFADAASGDFRVLNEEVLQKLQIKPVDYTDCGVTDGRLKEKAASPIHNNYEINPRFMKDDNVYEFEGMRLKRLEGLGEVSATGMYKETGVFIKEVTSGSKWWNIGLREKDVILAVGEQEIAEVKEAMKLLENYTGKLLIWREQGEKLL
ncbi:MAG: right-handed parallel beta-helix repeat-containing protein [Anaerocolumna sp.]